MTFLAFVVNFIIKWIETAPADWDQELLQILQQELIDQIESPVFAKKLQGAVDALLYERTKKGDTDTISKEPHKPNIMVREKNKEAKG